MSRDLLKLLVTCEHATPSIPARYINQFSGRRLLLSTHLGWDIGALNLASIIARSLKSPLIRSGVSRLLVDMNRSIGHPGLFSPAVRRLGEVDRIRILNRYYFPYRARVETAIGNRIRSGHSVLHLSIHSFTPVLRGNIRRTGIGLLFDPARNREREFCELWRRRIQKADPGWPVHFNLPYRGATDGLTSAMRRLWRENDYRGIELEVNQKILIGENSRSRQRMAEAVVSALRQAMRESSLP